MRLEQRMEYLLRAALRAERDGDHHIARSLRRMAEDIRPLESGPSRLLPTVRSAPTGI